MAKKSSKSAPLGATPGDAYRPKVGPDEVQDELTAQALILGILLSVIFGAANAYLGLKVGMTVSASIPAAVIGMGVLRGIFQRGTLLETNMVQTTGSAGESLAAGVIFTVPALILLSREFGMVPPDSMKIFAISCLGGILGVLFMIPLRKFLMVKEHGKLPFPEGTACAEVLSAGQEGGDAAKLVFFGLGFGAVYKLLMHFGEKLHLLVDEVTHVFSSLGKTAVGINLEASLLGVGFILGPQIAGTMLSGAVVGWLVLIPAIGFLGAEAVTPLYPSPVPIGEMGVWDIWNHYIRYIGAGAVAFGGVLSLFKALPMIFATLTSGIFGSSKSKETLLRTQQDLDTKYVLGGILAIGLLLLLLPYFNLSVPGVACLVFFSFFFTTVSARIVGIVGSSSNPASGMTIATLLATSLLLKFLGYTGQSGMMAAITIGSIVCIGICIGGDTSQDLKTGFLVGATPWKQQIGELVGVLSSALFVGFTLYLLDEAYVLGSKELAAPQASLMKLVVQGVMEGNLPWNFVFLGVFTGLAVELMGIGCLPFAVGLYLPIHLSTPIMIGGILRWAFEAFLKGNEKTEKVDKGILLASGLIAGEALMGVLLAAFVAFGPKPALPWPETVDGFGRVTQSRTLDGRLRTFVYEEDGRPGVGEVEFDIDGALYEEAERDSGERIVRLPTKRGDVLFKYDELSRLIERKGPKEELWTVTYADGETRATYVKEAGQSATYWYDSNQRLVRAQRSDGSEVSLTYDDAGRRARLRVRDREVRYSYDPLGRIQEIEDTTLGVFRLDWDGESGPEILDANARKAHLHFDGMGVPRQNAVSEGTRKFLGLGLFFGLTLLFLELFGKSRETRKRGSKRRRS